MPEAGFVEWAIARSGSIIDLGVDPLDYNTLSGHRWTEAPTLAAVGFRLHLAPTDTAVRQRWLEGIGRLMTRDPVPADRNSFFFSPLILLGLATGARSAETTDPSPLGWLRETMDTHANQLPFSTIWTRMLVLIAAKEVGAQSVALGSFSHKSPLDTALLLWLYLSDLQNLATTTSAGMPEVCRALLETAATKEIDCQGIAEQGIFLISLHNAVVATIGGIHIHASDATQFIVTICRRFPLFVEELSKRYDQRDPFKTKDEYDLQDILRSILRLHFDDIRQEEWNPSYGGAQSRSDFLLKPERIVVETKMTRKGLNQRKLVEQLTVDKAQYRGHSDCDTLICFVYDPGLRLGNPAALERDLSDNVDGMRTLVIVSPLGL